MAAHLSALSAIFTGIGAIVGPLVVWLLVRGKSKFADDHGREALNFGISMTGAGILVYVVIWSIYGYGFQMIVRLLVGLWFLLSAFVVIAAVHAGRGRFYRYPVSLRLIKGSPFPEPPEEGTTEVGTRPGGPRQVPLRSLGFLLVFLGMSVVSIVVVLFVTFVLFPPFVFIVVVAHDLSLHHTIAWALLYHSIQMAALLSYLVYTRSRPGGLMDRLSRFGRRSSEVLSNTERRRIGVRTTWSLLLFNEALFLVLFEISALGLIANFIENAWP